MPDSPQLPAGYPAMILLAMVPPLWFAVMDKKLDEWQQAYSRALTT
jgi:alkane 1-monooxygenase